MQVLLSITLTNGALATGLVMWMGGFPLLLLHLPAVVRGLGLAYWSSLLFDMAILLDVEWTVNC